MSALRQRAGVLIAQRRYDLAEAELRRALAQDPDDTLAHAALAQCLAALDRIDDALREARLAVAGGPDEPATHFALAQVLHSANRRREALAAADEALRLNPFDADVHGLRAAILFAQERASEALAAAEEGLAIDPDHGACIHVRGMALRQLGRRDDADEATEHALARDPEDALAHAHRGWAELETGEPARAIRHFREALRLDAELEWARDGLVNALKARNRLYAILLRGFLWLNRLGKGRRWMVVLGAWLLVRVLREVSRRVPEVEPWILPLVVIYVLFVLTSWLAAPLSTLVVRLDREGRLALSRSEVRLSNVVGGLLAAGAVAVLASIATGEGPLVWVAIGCLMLCIPVTATFSCDPGWPRAMMTVYTALVVVAGLGALALYYAPDAPHPLWSWTALAFTAGGMLSSWIGSLLAEITPSRGRGG